MHPQKPAEVEAKGCCLSDAQRCGLSRSFPHKRPVTRAGRRPVTGPCTAQPPAERGPLLPDKSDGTALPNSLPRALTVKCPSSGSQAEVTALTRRSRRLMTYLMQSDRGEGGSWNLKDRHRHLPPGLIFILVFPKQALSLSIK